MKKFKTTTYNFPIIIEKDADGFFVADCPDLVGCHTQGKSIESTGRQWRNTEAIREVKLKAAQRSLGERFLQLAVSPHRITHQNRPVLYASFYTRRLIPHHTVRLL